MAKDIVILLHGVGSRGDDLRGVAQLWSQDIPGVIVATPNGPQQFDMGVGYQWFSVNGVTDQSRPARILAARNAFDATLQGILAQHQLSASEDNIMLAGFSQGAIMALDMLVSNRLPLAGVVAFSGRLASPVPYQPADNAALLLVHGQDDPVIGWHESEKAAQQLSALGVAVESAFEAGVPHTITASGARKAAEFIARRFSRR
ncbi:phospholipase/carboxylesterase [Erwinia toletana]|uniref:Phospholipase/carboxylesterase n=1 Tax=Winslowiella toletana TaxID=92490 RepID=A0ABS4PDJ4_9GAMM|nr:dienelactone hydrolase family protein [Winslowiella toletana]MBP2170257.1 phospholipase/carboxylesterase [Winslowiella toletana]